MNGPGEVNRQPKFARAIARGMETHKHARSLLELTERLTSDLIGSAPQPPSPALETERPVPGSVADQLDDIIASIDRCVDRIEQHLGRLASEMVPPGPSMEPPRRAVAIER